MHVCLFVAWVVSAAITLWRGLRASKSYRLRKSKQNMNANPGLEFSHFYFFAPFCGTQLSLHPWQKSSSALYVALTIQTTSFQKHFDFPATRPIKTPPPSPPHATEDDNCKSAQLPPRSAAAEAWMEAITYHSNTPLTTVQLCQFVHTNLFKLFLHKNLCRKCEERNSKTFIHCTSLSQ